MKNNISRFNECANCGACLNICPTKAITVNSETLFYSLDLDNEKCVDCGKCVKVCPVNTPQKEQNLMSAFAGNNKDKKIVKKSSSGGVFYALAQYILSLDGVVFAAAYDDRCKKVIVKHTQEVDLEELLRSKYVESNVKDSFVEIKEFLENGRRVLFCGAPCQVAGLKRYLQKDFENLFTADFSCGGLPSHKIYEEYLKELEEKYSSEIKSVNFRPKTYGWSTYAVKVEFLNRKKYSNLAASDPYFAAFISRHYTVRDNCLTCRFADNHYSDIILADFWKYKKLSRLKEKNGLSLVITNSDKGEKLFESIKKEFNYITLDLDKASYNIKKPFYSDEFIKNRKKFFDKYEKCGLSIAASEYIPTWKKVLEIKIKARIKRVLGK